METDEKEAPLISYGEKETKKMVSSLDLYKSSSSAGSSAKKSLDLKRTEDRLLTMMRELMHHSVEFDRRGKRDHATAKKVVYSRIEKYIRHFFDRLLEAFQHANTNKDQVLVAQAELRKLAKNLKQNEQWTWSAKEVGRELGKKLNLSLQQLDSRTDMMKENRDAYTR